MIHKNWQELIKPTQLVVKPGADAARVATVIAVPLERGFGLALGIRIIFIFRITIVLIVVHVMCLLMNY